MADIPQEVREAAMSDHERFIVAVAYDCGYQAGLEAGKRAGMERAAEIADVARGNWADCSRRFPDTPAIDASAEAAEAIAQAIRSENDGHG